jgi:murein DD-endopeptidase MepM/ murein hydrolase activator NlpD
MSLTIALGCATEPPIPNHDAAVKTAPTPQPAEQLLPQPSPVTCNQSVLQSGETLGHLLTQASLSNTQRQNCLRHIAQEMPLRRIRPGLTLTRCIQEKRLTELRLSKPTADSYLRLTPIDDDDWAMSKVPIALTRTTRVFNLKVERSIGEAVGSARAHMSLTPLLAEVLAWDMDLRRDVKKDDELSVLVEELSNPNGVFMRYPRILALAYQGTERQFAMYAFDTPDGETRYYDASGASVERSLLSTPMRFTRISSTFSSKRKHPILGYTKAHNGVDYAAPTGTPIWSVGRGRVTYAAWKGPNGKMIRIDHGNGITTAYAHLSKIMPGIKRGVRVTPKQIIGKVGTTGRSTGPHLHFAMKKYGRFVNPLKMNRPRLKALSPAQLPKFDQEVNRLKRLLSASNLNVNTAKQ